MHTWTNGNPDNEIRIHHNGDYSGDVKLIVPADVVGGLRLNGEYARDATEFAEAKQFEIELPFETLRNFVLSKMRSDMIGALENMSDDELWESMTS